MIEINTTEKIVPNFDLNIDINIKINEDQNNYAGYKNPCDNCPNNPMLNPLSGGFCCCMLPYLYGDAGVRF